MLIVSLMFEILRIMDCRWFLILILFDSKVVVIAITLNVFHKKYEIYLLVCIQYIPK